MSTLSDFRKSKDEFFRNDPDSPLTDEQKKDFKGLNYFPENPNLRLNVKVQAFQKPEEVHIQTSTGDVREYDRYGRFEFTVNGQDVMLTIYRNETGYFLPFVDSLAGKETYPAGRYVEVEAGGGDHFVVDFNYAYNPYCAYNDKWSCPLAPFENKLKVPIEAGEKLFHE
jgi:uncharacterized protein (DUF1684 family)